MLEESEVNTVTENSMQDAGIYSGSGVSGMAARLRDILGIMVAFTALLVFSSCDDQGDSYCGNGVLDREEQCDGQQFGPYTCEWFGFSGGRLACDDSCEINFSTCTGYSPLCGNGALDGVEQCDGTNLGGHTCADLGYDGGVLACMAACVFDTSQCEGCPSPCFDEGTRRCTSDGSALEICMKEGECLHWVTRPCQDVCDPDILECVTCDATCTNGEMRCSEDGRAVLRCSTEGVCPVWETVQECSQTEKCTDEVSPRCTEGCTDECHPAIYDVACSQDMKTWFGCVLGDDGCYHEEEVTCDPTGWCIDAALGCSPRASGESCSEELEVPFLPFVLSGTSFNDDYESDATYIAELQGCEEAEPMLGGDLFMFLHMTADEEILFWEQDSRTFSDYTLLVMDSCDATGQCLTVASDARRPLIHFVAPHDGIYHFVVVRNYSSMSDYEIHLAHPVYLGQGDECSPGDPSLICPPDTVCMDASDTNHFCMPAETSCGDGSDNDGDDLLDCSDPDCFQSPQCASARGYWESFQDADSVDLEGWCISFVPSSMNRFSYTMNRDATGSPVSIGGNSVMSLPCADTMTQEVNLPFQFTFFGTDYSRAVVSADGWLALGQLRSVMPPAPSETGAFSNDLIMAYWSDLVPGSNCSIVVDSGTLNSKSWWAVEWNGLVHRYGSPPEDMQAILWEDGTVSLCYSSLEGMSGFAGITHWGDASYPEQSNLAPTPEEGDLCLNGRDDDLDGATDCDDASCAPMLRCDSRAAWYQFFDTEYVDLRVHTLTFVPDGQGGYRTLDATVGASPWVTPGSTPTSYSLNVPHGGGVWSSLGFDFPYYYSRTYDSVLVHSDGFVSFDGFGENGYWLSYPKFFDHPMIAAFWSSRLQVESATVDTGTDSDTGQRFWALTVTSHRSGVPSERLDYQLVLFEDGTVRISYRECFDSMSGIAGLSGGGQVGAVPAEQDLVIPAEQDATLCSNGVDDDLDGDVDCDDRDCNDYCTLWPYEWFRTGNDLEGHVLIFEPKTQSHGFSWRVGDATGFFVDPTSGAAQEFSVWSGDDVFSWRLPYSFPYDGTDRQTIWISTNGWISFNFSSDSAPLATPSRLFSRDMVAVAWDDLDYMTGSSLTVHEGTSDDGRQWAAVTWYLYTDFSGQQYVSAQAVLFSDGEIRFYYPRSQLGSILVGTGFDNGGSEPPQHDLVK